MKLMRRGRLVRTSSLVKSAPFLRRGLSFIFSTLCLSLLPGNLNALLRAFLFLLLRAEARLGRERPQGLRIPEGVGQDRLPRQIVWDQSNPAKGCHFRPVLTDCFDYFLQEEAAQESLFTRNTPKVQGLVLGHRARMDKGLAQRRLQDFVR